MEDRSIELLEVLTARLEKIERLLDHAALGLDDWVDEATVKELTGLGKSTLYMLRKNGDLTSSRFSKRKVYYRRSDLGRLLDKNEKEQTQ